ncbi:MAG TPA: LPS export ABC transporter permease LptF [Candidatus Binatia bacterium]|nr:LPS export ABC transporter permease LptF [Candidatus Binatia bacterium]
MRRSILDRYVLREALSAWAAVTIVLLAIMLATRFTRFLADAAAGKLPQQFLLKVVALSSVQYLVLLIPVSLLLAVLLALGRLYRDSEIAAMTGCGAGPRSIYRPVMGLAGAIALLTALLSLQLGPWAGRQVDQLIKDARQLVQFTPFEPGRFKALAGGRAVFYTARMSEGADRLETVFAVVEDTKGTSVVTAHEGAQTIDPQTGDRVVVLSDGWRFAGEAGRADYDVVKFDRFTTRVTPPPIPVLTGKRWLMETRQLLGSDNLEDRAELAWRISAPLSVLLLALIAVPLAHTTPRQGRYNQLVLGLVAYLVYGNLIAFGQGAMAGGTLPAALGLWWVHGLAAALALWLNSRRLAWSWWTPRGRRGGA